MKKPLLSKRAEQMPASPIRKLVPYADYAKSKGIEVIHLNIGQPDIETPQQVLDAIQHYGDKVLAYGPSQGLFELRTKLELYYAEFGIEVSAEDITITTGGSEALSMLMGSLCDSGDNVIIPEPFYANYNGFASSYAIEVRSVASSIETNFALPDVSLIESQIDEKTRAILICNPGNPTGYLYTDQELNALKDLALKYNLFLIADEVYREFVYESQKHTSVLKLEDCDQHVVVVDSFSKRYSMCGARVGCIVSKNKELNEAVLKFAQARLCPPTLAQLACIAALNTSSSYFKAVNAEYDKRRRLLIELLSDIPKVKVAYPKGAFYCMIELEEIESADDFAQWLLESFNLNGQTVMLAPASGFYSHSELGKRQLRIAYVLESGRLEQAVAILRTGLEQYSNQNQA